MISETIPRVASDLNTRFANATSDQLLATFTSSGETCSHHIRDLLHAHGINIRFLGAVRSLVKAPLVRRLLLLELVSRVIKHDTNASLRLISSTDVHQCRQLLIETFNQVFGEGTPESRQYWNALPLQLQMMFPLALTDEEMRSDLRASISDGFPGIDLLFELLKHQLSVSLPPRATKTTETMTNGIYVPYDLLQASALVEFQPRVKRIDVARILEKLQVVKGDGKAAMFLQELVAREKALGSMHPQVAFTLENYGEALVADGAFELADEAFARALTIRRFLSQTEGGALALADTLEKIFTFYSSVRPFSFDL
jgi:hypothetical protein